MAPATGYESISSHGAGQWACGGFAADLELSPIPACPGCCEGKCNEACWFLKQLVSSRMNEMKLLVVNMAKGRQLGSAA